MSKVVSVRLGYENGENDWPIGVATPEAAFDLLAGYLLDINYGDEGFVGSVDEGYHINPAWTSLVICRADDMAWGNPPVIFRATFVEQEVHSL